MKKSDLQSIFAISIISIISLLIAYAGSQGGIVVYGKLSLFSLCIIIAYIIQIFAFIPAFIKQTEKFYDLIGSFTYISIILIAVFFSPGLDIRKIIITIFVLIWALRLGSYLFLRILRAGKDKRFDDIKKSGYKFFTTWMTQGLWVSITLSAALASITVDNSVPFGIIDSIAIVIWIIGFLFEFVADSQKKKFREKPENQEKFINIGLWSISRHPNYFGEITLWIGIAILALPTLEGLRFFTLISPIFVAVLIIKISGIPKLERYADKKWGNQEDYELYKKNTPLLIPRLFKTNIE